MTAAKHDYNYWTLYYRDTRDLAICLRSTSEENEMDQPLLRRMLNDLVQRGIIKDELPLLRTNYRDCRSDWELSIAFELCPCIEIYQLKDAVLYTEWDWKQITHV